MTDAKMTDLEVKDRTRDKRREEMKGMELSRDTGMLMVPTDGRDLMDKANTMATAGLIIKDIFRDNPGACAGLIMLCAPYRINPFQASWKCYQVKPDAPLAFEAQLITAMVNTAAPISGRIKYTFEGEGVTRRVIVSAVDRDSGEVLDYTSPMFKDVGIKNSPLWKNDPDQQMCYAGARAFARRHYPEILLGVYDRDELRDAAPLVRDVTPTGHTVATPITENSILASLDDDDDGEVQESPNDQEAVDQRTDLASATAGDFFDETDPTPTAEEMAAAEAAAREVAGAEG